MLGIFIIVPAAAAPHPSTGTHQHVLSVHSPDVCSAILLCPTLVYTPSHRVLPSASRSVPACPSGVGGRISTTCRELEAEEAKRYPCRHHRSLALKYDPFVHQPASQPSSQFRHCRSSSLPACLSACVCANTGIVKARASLTN